MARKILVLAWCFVALIVTASATTTDFLIIAPKTLTVGASEIIAVHAYHLTKACSVSVFLTDVNSGENIVSGQVHFDGDVQAASQIIELAIPSSLPKSVYNVTASAPGFSSSESVSISTKSVTLLIETDKPIYKANGKIFANVYAIDSRMKAVSIPMEISVVNPGNFVLSSSKITSDAKGTGSISFQLSEEPQLGVWQIVAKAQGIEARVNVTVSEYVLPRYEVRIKLDQQSISQQIINPSSYSSQSGMGHEGEAASGGATSTKKPASEPSLDKTPFLTGTIDALYTYGKKVKGTLQLTLYSKSRQVAMWGARPMGKMMPDAPASSSSSSSSDGDEYHLVTKQTVVSFDGSYRFTFTANQIPEAVRQNGVGEFLLEASVLELNSDAAEKSQASIPVSYSFGASIKQIPDDESSPIQLIRGRSTTFRFIAQDEKGTPLQSTFSISIYATNSSWATIPAEKFHAPNTVTTLADGTGKFDVMIPDEELRHVTVNVFRENLAYFTFRTVTMFSPSNSYLQVTSSSQSGLDYAIGSTAEFRVSFFGNAEISSPVVFYSLVARGDIVRTGTVSSDGLIRLELPPESAPVAHLLVHTITFSGEVVAAQLPIHVRPQLLNDLSISTSADEVKPGSSVSISVSSGSGSTVSLKAIDDAVYALSRSSGSGLLTLDTIYDAIEQLGNADLIKDESEGSNMWRWRPPSIGQAAADSFEKANVIVLSNRAVPRAPEDDYRVMEMAPMAKGAAQDMAGASAASAASLSSGVPITRVRRFFPETWIWQSLQTDSNGIATLRDLKAPDSITTYKLSGVSMSAEHGIGIAQADLRVFQPFFVSVDLPFSAIRGEVLIVNAIVFNYAKNSASSPIECTVSIQPDETNHIELLSPPSISGLSVSANGGSAVASFKIRTLRVGEVPIQISATTSSSLSDLIEKPLRIEPEGIPQHISRSVFIDHSGGDSLTLHSLSTALPSADELVPNSARATISVIGDLMGPTMENLDSLIRMPYGCGEQNMINTAPNVFVADYLKATGRLESSISERALKLMQIGYQRELNYRHDDGSFSAFGKQDVSDGGSSWLTAFVLRTFSAARDYIFVDQKLLDDAADFLIRSQKPDGSFPTKGRILDTFLKGGMIAHDGAVATHAYTLIALLESRSSKSETAKPQWLQNALRYLEQKSDALKETYPLALVSYALNLGGSSQADQVFARFLAKATDAPEGLRWADGPKKESSDSSAAPAFCFYCGAGSSSAEIETTAYGLLLFIRRNEMSNAYKVARWLLTKRSAMGGFYSTQDTIVGLQALSAYASKLRFGDSQRLGLTFTTANENESGKRTTTTSLVSFELNSENFAVMQTLENVPLTTPIQIKAQGSGMAIVQLAIEYNVVGNVSSSKNTSLVDWFDLLVDYEDHDANKKKVKACAKYRGKEADSGMVVLEAGLHTGHVVAQKSLEHLLGTKQIKRIEVEDRQVVFYFDRVASSSDVCVEFFEEDSSGVTDLQPPASRVYSYYRPNERAEVVKAAISRQILVSPSVPMLTVILLVGALIIVVAVVFVFWNKSEEQKNVPHATEMIPVSTEDPDDDS